MSQLGPRSLLICSLLLFSTAGSAFAWTGRLVDANDAPVANARVTPIGRTGGVLSNAEGVFNIPGSLSGVLTLLVETADGQARVVEADSADADENGVVTVRVDKSRTETVRAVVPASGDLVAPPGSSTTTLSEAEVRSRVDTSVQEIIASIPGTEAASTDPDRPPAIRGLVQGRTLLLVDGAVLGTERRAGVSGGVLHSGSWGGVEVLRGPASVEYGSAAMGGVILMKSPWSSAAGSAFEVELESAFGDAESVSAALRGHAKGWSYSVAGRDNDDPESADGTALLGAFQQLSLFAGKSWSSEKALFRVGVRADRLSDAARLTRADDPSALVPEETLERITYRWERPGVQNLDVLAWLSSSSREIQQDLRFVSDAAISTVTDRNDVGARVVWRGGTKRGATWTLGGEARSSFGIKATPNTIGIALSDLPPGTVPADGSLPLDDGVQSAIAAFAAGATSFGSNDEWTLEAGARVEPISSEAQSFGEDRDTDEVATAANVALSRRIGKHGWLTAQWARGFREPTITERFYQGVTGRGFILRNVDLEREVSNQWDLNYTWSTTRAQIQAAAFSIEIEDIVIRDRLPPGPLGLDVFQLINADEGKIEGLEASSSFDGGVSGEWVISAQWMQGADGFGANLDDIPAESLRVRWSKDWERIGLRADASFEDDDDDPGPGERVVPGHVRLGIGARFMLGESWELDLAVENPFDSEYFDSARDDAPVAPGRTGIVRLRWRTGS